jgi:hypothetical protein
MSVPMRPSDPAYFLLEQGITDPSKRSVPTVSSPTCYICRDPEYALMGLPLCSPCSKCGGHVAADDSVCDACGYDQQDDIPEQTPEGQERIQAESDAFIAAISKGSTTS